MQQHYQTINAFYDCYGLSNARSLLSKMIKTADSGKIYTSRSPSDLLFFSEKLEELIEAVFAIVGRYNYKTEAILDRDKGDKCWELTEYETYCGWHINYSPWDYFPRHLNKTEFLNPYKALEKFTNYRSLYQWKDVLKEFLFHALSPNSIDEFDDGTSILRTYIYLHKLIETTHLIELRTNKETNQRHRNKWKEKNESENQPQSSVK